MAEQQVAVGAVPVLQLRLPDGTTHIHLRWWSIEPNDLEGVVFGVSQVVWAPNVPEEEYEAYLEQERARAAREAEQAAEDARRRAAEEDAHRAKVVVEAPKPVKGFDPEQLERDREQLARRERERAEQARRDEERRRAEAERRRIEAERRRQFCASHPDDRGCWGPGGLRMKLDLDARIAEAQRYCRDHHEDARCWTDADWARIKIADQQRIGAATTVTKPTTPPPAPLAETMPPKLSAHAEWRPGYWHWIDNTWVWLAGMWRVPEADIVANQTTIAPAAPPPPQAETPPAPPVQAAVWVAGFWQWDGATWVWVPGSWQLRPSTTVTWRAATWQARGSVHILVPGAWVRIGGGAR